MNYNIYDFDGTIYDGDSSFDFIKFCFLKNKRFFIFIPKYFCISISYLTKKMNKTEFKEEVFSFLKKVDNIDELINNFWSKYEFKIKDFYKTKSHDKDIIISAGPYFLLKYITDKYKVFDLIATKVDKKTGKINGLNCFGSEKVKLLNEKYPNIVINSAYTDSLNDLPLLNLAKKGYIVNKNTITDFEKNRRTL